MNALKWFFIFSFSLVFIAVFMISERNTTLSSLRSIHQIGFFREGRAIKPEALPGLERMQAEKALQALADLDRFLDLAGPVQRLNALLIHMDSTEVYRSQPDMVEISWDLFLNPSLLKKAILKSVVMQFDPAGLFASHLEYEVLATFLLEISGQSDGWSNPIEKTLDSRAYLTHLDTWEQFCAGGVESEPLWRLLCPSILRSERLELFPRWSSLESWMAALLSRSFKEMGWRDRLVFARSWLENRRQARGHEVYFSYPSHHLTGLDELEFEIYKLLSANFQFSDSESAGSRFRKILDENLRSLLNAARSFHLVLDHQSPNNLDALHAYFLRLNRHSPNFKVALASGELHAFVPGPWLHWPQQLSKGIQVQQLIGARCEWPTLRSVRNWASKFEGMDHIVIVQDCPEFAEPLDFYGLLGGGTSSFVGRNMKHALAVFDSDRLDEFLNDHESDFRMKFSSRLRPQSQPEADFLGRLEWNPKLHAFEQRVTRAALRWLRGGQGEILQLEPAP